MMAFVVIAILSGCGSSGSKLESIVGETTQYPQETVAMPSEEVELFSEVKMSYLTVALPEDMFQMLGWREVEEGDSKVIVVTLELGNRDFELYRICFGEEYASVAIGVMNLGEEEAPVAVIATVHEAEEMSDDQMLEDYSYAMESLQYVMSVIRNDSRFYHKEDVIVEKVEEQLGYWLFKLPENMECVEGVVDDTYEMSFYGAVNGESYLLYTVCVGEKTLANVLGVFEVDGVDRMVSIESIEPPATDGWDEAEANRLYAMMDSINDTIATIVESQGFSKLEE